MHFPYNTTPQGILSGLLVNDSNYCPSIALTQEHGCITVNAWGNGADWPFFLELMADPERRRHRAVRLVRAPSCGSPRLWDDRGQR